MVEHPYDLFISYAEADRAWVEGHLLDALSGAGVRCCTEAAFALGAPRLAEFERAVRESRRTLLVLSPAYLAEGFAQFTDLLAQSYGLETATWPVIPLVLRPVELPPRLAMLIALDATDPASWSRVIERLCAELERPVPGPAAKPPCPYPGMLPFSEADAGRFFGREREVQELVERLRLHPFLTVIGPSGSGKSSLVFAGLIPALRGSGLFGVGGWLVRTLRPGENPLAALNAALGDGRPDSSAVAALLATQPDARHVLLVVDQFEELFTLAHVDEVEPFQQTLLRLSQTPNCYLVLTVRADFYPDLMATSLWPHIQAHRAEVLPLDEKGLREAIVRPAEDAGVCVEPALVERLVEDAGREPGVLPLVQETLALLWERLERRFLPLATYAALGDAAHTGLQMAMARRADAALAELPPEQQAIARRIFLRLVQFGEGRADTRRQQPVAALRAASDVPGAFECTLEHLTRSRLLTLSGEEAAGGRRVDIAHEALIGGWPTLQGWLAERREAEQTRRRLETKAAEWIRLGRGEGGLLDEIELAEAERWLASPDAALLGYSEMLPALVQASRAMLARQQAQQRRAARFRLATLGAIAALIIVALGIGLWSARRIAGQQQEAAATAQAYAVEQERLAGAEATARAEAETQRQEALNAQAAAEQQARRALSGQLAAQAQAALEKYPIRSLLLAVEALSVTEQAGEHVPAAEQALRDVLANTGGRGLGGHSGLVNSLAISPNGRWLATGSSDGTARIWDLTTPDPSTAPIVLLGCEGMVRAVGFSPDSHWLATAGGDSSSLIRDSTIHLWDLTAADPAAESIILRGHEGPIEAVAFSPDGRWLASGSWDNTARLWDLTTPDPAAASIVLRGHEDIVNTIAISPDSHWLATGSQDETVRLWDLTAENPADAAIILRGHESIIRAVTISPDGRWLATSSEDATARLWDLAATDPSVAPIVLHGHDEGILAAAISPDGHWLATGSRDHTARLWDLTTPDPATNPIVLRGHEDIITAVAISPDGRWLVTGGKDGTARRWDLTAIDSAASAVVLRGHDEGTLIAIISPDSHWLVTDGWDGTVRLWDLTIPDPAAEPIILRDHQGTISAVAISSDSHWLVTAGGDDAARLWDLTALDPAMPIILRGHTFYVLAVAFSPNGRWLATGSKDSTARLWDLTVPNPSSASTVLRGHEGAVYVVAFSPDNRWLVTGSEDTTARLWDLTTSDPAAAPIVLRSHTDVINAVAFSPDGHWLATAGGDPFSITPDYTVRLWDLTTSDPAAASIVLRGHKGFVRTIAFSANNHWLASGSTDGTACLWDLTALDAAVPIVLRGHKNWIEAIAISPDSRWLVTAGGDDAAHLWDLTALDPTAASITLHGHDDSIEDVAISPDSHWLVTGSRDATARLWDLTAPNPAAEPIVLRGHEGWIRAVAISPDNRWLVTGSEDTTAHLWDLRLDELIALACRTAGRNLTRAEWEQYFPGQIYRKTCDQWPLEGEE